MQSSILNYMLLGTTYVTTMTAHLASAECLSKLGPTNHIGEVLNYFMK